MTTPCSCRVSKAAAQLRATWSKKSQPALGYSRKPVPWAVELFHPPACLERHDKARQIRQALLIKKAGGPGGHLLQARRRQRAQSPELIVLPGVGKLVDRSWRRRRVHPRPGRFHPRRHEGRRVLRVGRVGRSHRLNSSRGVEITTGSSGTATWQAITRVLSSSVRLLKRGEANMAASGACRLVSSSQLRNGASTRSKNGACGQ